MVEVNGVPLIAYLLGWLVKYGVTQVVLSCGYRWEVLQICSGRRRAVGPRHPAMQWSESGSGAAAASALPCSPPAWTVQTLARSS